MLNDVLEAFEAAIEHAEVADTHHKAARKVVDTINSLSALQDALPEDMRPVTVDEDIVAELRSLTSTVISPELQALKAKVEAAITLGADAGLVDFDEEGARALMERYVKLQTSFGSKKSTGTSAASGIRALSQPIAFWLGENKRTSGGRTGGGDWTQVRWQITDHAKSHDGVAKEALDMLRTKVQQVESGEVAAMDETITAGDGTEYRVQYPEAL